MSARDIERERAECGVERTCIAKDGRPYFIRKVKCVKSCECANCEHNPKKARTMR